MLPSSSEPLSSARRPPSDCRSCRLYQVESGSDIAIHDKVEKFPRSKPRVTCRSSDVTQTLPPLILASTSRYRRELLARLGLPFECRAPDADESPRAGERPDDLARRLAAAKAAS